MINGLLGIPWKERGRDRGGVDCWGVVYLYHQEIGIEIPRYDGRGWSSEDREDAEALVREGLPLWLSVTPGEERPGDMIHLRIAGHPIHVGLVAGEGQMVHACFQWQKTVLESYRHERWRRRILGFYRWP